MNKTEATVTRRVVLRFPRSRVDQPIMCRLAREFNIDFNILKASVTPKEEGLLVVELSGTSVDYEKGLNYLAETDVEIQPLSQDVIRNETRCTHCGACVVMCPTEALTVDLQTRKVDFDDTKCIACGICYITCPDGVYEVI